ncbi:MAG TPA: HAD-IA family hydrolase [Casimicrobiaceae bacterium]|nr:HAD-IA family hydrolase [Casimicrobiaceae bacterium]
MQPFTAKPRHPLTTGPRTLPIAAVLFDLDGTLADTAGDLAAALNRVRGDRDLPPLPVATLRPHASDGSRGMLGTGLGVTREHPEWEALKDAFLDYYAAALAVHTRLFADAERVLAEIARRRLAWGIVTNKAARFTLPLLDHLGLASRADVIVCGDTTPHAKPHPEPLLHAAAQLRLSAADCVYVGDAERDVAAARAAGMAALVARYGYIAADAGPEAWQPDGFIDSLPALLDWLPGAAVAQPGQAPALR